MKTYLDRDGLLYLWNKIKLLFATKVDRVDGKGLSTNDYATEDKAAVTANTAARHTHGNAAVLGEITADKLTTWDSKLDRAGGTMTGILTLSGNPTGDWEAATKKYVDDSMSETGQGDMLKHVYDPQNKAQDVFDYIDRRPQGRLVHYKDISERTSMFSLDQFFSACKSALDNGYEVFGEMTFHAGQDGPDGVTTASMAYIHRIADSGEKYFVLLCNADTSPYLWFKLVSGVNPETGAVTTAGSWVPCGEVHPASAAMPGLMSAADFSKLAAFAPAEDYALKANITGVYRYKGSKGSFAGLPMEANVVGDVWNVEDTGMNYAWTGKEWDALGEIMEIESISNAEIDTLLT